MTMIKRRMAQDAKFRKRYEERAERQARHGGEPLGPPTQRETMLVGWTGMRGILTLAAAGSIPEDVPGRDAILAIALFVTLGTLLIQGTTIKPAARWLKFDLTAERAEAEAMREKGREMLRSVQFDRSAGGDFASAGADLAFDAQRKALGQAVADRVLSEEIAREMIEEIDLRQAALHTAPPGWPGLRRPSRPTPDDAPMGDQPRS
jgi:CPA1 family monovalent cation:H+ antiporter